MLQVQLPYPPSINHYWRMWRGRMVISEDGRRYRAVVQAMFRVGGPPLEGPLCVAIDLYPPDHRRRDCDNTLKALLDAMQHAGVYRDDSQIVWLLTQKATVVPEGKAIVRIWVRGSATAALQQLEQITHWSSLSNLN